MINKPLYIYDIETTYSCFLFGGKFHGDSNTQVFEISWRNNHKQQLLEFLSYLKNIDAHMVGYNNLAFDYPVIHDIMTNPMLATYSRIYDTAQKIIGSQKYGQLSSIQLYKRIIHQIDLLKIWHFDNDAKRTRLKDLEVAMRSQTVEDLPYDFRKPLSSEQIDEYIKYMCHDITETEKFLGFTAERLKLRKDLLDAKVLTGDVLNWNDTKIGEQFFITKLGRDFCYNGREPKKTERLSVAFNDVILPKIEFRLPQYQEVLETFRSKLWIKGDKDHNATIPFQRVLGDIELAFGSGGLHGSVKNKVFRESATHKIIDIDVSGMYPAVGIANGFYPEHLGQKFVDVYRQLKFDRKQHKKGTAMNSVLKLAQNGTYGKSNSEYSPIYDPKYMFSITVNGQLQNLQLFEMMSHIPGLQFIQDNTDGMTLYVPREYEWLFNLIKRTWEKETGLELEQVEYSAMFVADVNNYLAVKKDGSIKRIGKYWFAESWEDYDAAAGKWHMDTSLQVVAKVAEQVMVYGKDAMAVLKSMTDPFDFMIRQKVRGAQVCKIGDKETQRTVRYYVSKAGSPMTIVRPAAGPVGSFKRKPKLTDKFFEMVLKEVGDRWDSRIHVGKANKPETQTKYEDQKSNIQNGWLVKDCCDAAHFNWQDVDYDFYLSEVNKLIIKE